MGGQIGLPVLVLGDLEFAARARLAAQGTQEGNRSAPLIQAHGILHKQQCLFRQERRAQRGREVQLVQKHPDDAWGKEN